MVVDVIAAGQLATSPAQCLLARTLTRVTPDPFQCGNLNRYDAFRPKGSWAMKCSTQSFAFVSVLVAVLLLLSAGTLNALDADLASHTFAAAQTAKQKCINTCRARYRECRSLKQMPSIECRNVYQDCTRLTCNGLVD